MVKTNPEDLMKMQTEAFRMSSAAATKTLEGFQKLAALNMETAKSSLEQSAEQIRALLAAKDAKTLTELVTSYTRPSPEKFTAYARAVMAITKEAGSDLSAIVEKQVAESNAQLTAAIEELAKNAPAGSEGMIAFVRQALAAASTAYDQVNSATRQFAEKAEASISGANKKR